MVGYKPRGRLPHFAEARQAQRVQHVLLSRISDIFGNKTNYIESFYFYMPIDYWRRNEMFFCFCFQQ